RHLDRAAASGRSQVAAIGWAQEYAPVASARTWHTDTGVPQFAFGKAQRRVSCVYFYLWDEQMGPAFIKVTTYFPYPIKIWVNGHEWAKRQATAAGIGFTPLSNGLPAWDAPEALQAWCDRLGPADLQAFCGRWLRRLPVPLTGADEVA